MSCIETVRRECGEVLGEAAGYLWVSINVVEILTGINGGEEAGDRFRTDTAGKKGSYATLNIMAKSANNQIERLKI